MAKRYWLVKSEPDVYSIDDLAKDGRTSWEGIRNYKARNNLRDMRVGDELLFYHSNANPPGIMGVARVCREAYPDPFAFDPNSRYFDAKSDAADPRWFMVDVAFVAKAETPVTLPDVKAEPSLADMELLKYGRLSVQSVTSDQFSRVSRMAGIR